MLPLTIGHLDKPILADSSLEEKHFGLDHIYHRIFCSLNVDLDTCLSLGVRSLLPSYCIELLQSLK